jgi:hypothetical protein
MTNRGSPFKINRRQFFPALLREINVLFNVSKGGTACQLGDLHEMPDDQLAAIIPMANPAFEISVSGLHVYGRVQRNGEVVKDFHGSAEDFLTINLIDGERSLGEIGGEIAMLRHCEGAVGYALARDTFLRLVGTLLFIPRGPARNEA